LTSSLLELLHHLLLELRLGLVHRRVGRGEGVNVVEHAVGVEDPELAGRHHEDVRVELAPLLVEHGRLRRLGALCVGDGHERFAQTAPGADDDVGNLLLLAADLVVLVDLDDLGRRGGAGELHLAADRPSALGAHRRPRDQGHPRRDDRDGQHANDDRLLH
jgi:hypothetical protein